MAEASPNELLKINRKPANAPQRRKRWRIGIIATVAVVIGAALLRPKAVEVQIVSAVLTTPSSQYQELTASGFVVAQRRAAPCSKATGRLLELNVREGSRVKAGELLARLDASDVQAQFAVAQAAVGQAQALAAQGVALLRQSQVEFGNAEAELARSRKLQGEGFVSPQVLDTAQRRLDAARAGLASAQAGVAQGQSGITQAQAQLAVQRVNQGYTEIRAPFDGVVLAKNANVGDLITPFSNAAGSQGAVVTLADLSTLEVEADVSEGSLGKVKVGQPVEIQLDALPGQRFRGQVASIVPTVDRAKATVMTKVQFEKLDARILPEMSAKVAFLSQRASDDDLKPVLAVPAKALDGERVWKLVKEGETEKLLAVAVKPGRKLGEVVEVSVDAKLLASGDGLVATPRDLREGQKVTVVSKVTDRGLTTGVPLIRLRALAKSYQRGDQHIPVLEGIDLDVPAGDFVALMGPSGSGKSTLLNLLAGIDHPTSGSIEINGTDIATLSEAALADWRAANIGFIFQFYNLMPVLTALENVELPLLLTDLSARQRREHALAALSLVALSDRLDHYPNELSGGQQQRVAIARALVTDPTLIVADEPTGDLDRHTAEEVLSLLQRLNRELGKTIVMVTHDPKAAARARRLVELEKGVLVHGAAG